MGLSGELIQVGGTSYVKTSLTGPQYQKSESDASAVDEATDMTEEDIAELREQLSKVQPTKGEDVACGDKQCYTVTIDLDAAELQSLGGELPTEELPADMSEASVNATFKIEKDTLRPAGVDLTMDLGSQGNVTVAVTLSNWDEPVSIEAPPADQVQSLAAVRVPRRPPRPRRGGPLDVQRSGRSHAGPGPAANPEIVAKYSPLVIERQELSAPWTPDL